MTASNHITVLLADDHAILRQGLRWLLHADGHFRVVSEARTGREAVAMAQSFQPDVILMDIGMPLLNGLEATRQILVANPKAKIVILSAHTDDEYVRHMIDAGAVGFLEKHTSSKILTKALAAAAKGVTFFSPSILKRLRDAQRRALSPVGLLKRNRLRLTSRETEVLQLVAEGLGNKQVASELVISIKTVEKHRQSLMDKLNIHDTAGLTRYAITVGVITVDAQLIVV